METYEFTLNDAGSNESPSWHITASSVEEAWATMATIKNVSTTDVKKFININIKTTK
jgi:hypothetical protein